MVMNIVMTFIIPMAMAMIMTNVMSTTIIYYK